MAQADFGSLDGNHALDPPPKPLVDPAEVKARTDDFDKQSQQGRAALAGIAPRTHAATQQLEGRMDAVPLPQLQPLPPPPKPQHTSAEAQWGSAAMIFAALGSLLTRQPLTTALNSAAGVLNAFKKGDQEASQAEYERWKTSNDNALKTADFQQKTYGILMQNFARREGLQIQGGGLDERAQAAELAATAHALHDPIMAQTLAAGGMDRAYDLYLKREKAKQNWETATTKSQDKYIIHQRVDEMAQEFRDTHPGEEPPPELLADMYVQASHEVNPKGDDHRQAVKIKDVSEGLRIYNSTYPVGPAGRRVAADGSPAPDPAVWLKKEWPKARENLGQPDPTEENAGSKYLQQMQARAARMKALQEDGTRALDTPEKDRARRNAHVQDLPPAALPGAVEVVEGKKDPAQQQNLPKVEVIDDNTISRNGKMYRYKGTGNRDLEENWEPATTQVPRG